MRAAINRMDRLAPTVSPGYFRAKSALACSSVAVRFSNNAGESDVFCYLVFFDLWLRDLYYRLRESQEARARSGGERDNPSSLS